MKIYLFLFGLWSTLAMSQTVDLKSDVKTFQKQLNTEYTTEATSPLRGENFSNFKAHRFFPIQEKYKVKAKLVRTKEDIVINFPTSSGEIQIYKEFGKVFFKLNGKENVLTVYTNDDLANVPGYEDYLFLPFRDATNGKETYGGGKYIDLKIPTEEDSLVIDFNKSYQPYCAYNAVNYSCPIVPEVNHLKIEVKAGVMYDDVYFN